MEEEIDLRQYIVVLWQRKYWLIGLTLGAAVVALVVSFLLPKTYETTALVVVVRPRYTVQFDPRVSTNVVQPSNRVYLDLATSGQLLNTLIDDLALGAGNDSVEVREQLKATAGQDPSVIKLTVTDRDPQQAVRIANRWAELLVSKAEMLYNPIAQDMSFFQAQLDDAQVSLAQAEQNLIDFQARNRFGILSQRLERKRALLHEYLEGMDSLELLIQDAQRLVERLKKQDPAARATLADELSALSLQMAAQRATFPVQLQVTDLQSLTGKTVREQLALLDSLISAMQEKRDSFEQNIQALTPEILELQTQVEQYNLEEGRLKLAKDVAQDAVVVLARKVAETGIIAQEGQKPLRVASTARAPRKPVAPRKLFNTAVAGVLGLMVGVIGVLAVEWWQDRTGEPGKGM